MGTDLGPDLAESRRTKFGRPWLDSALLAPRQ
jgi:hypothetical protein